MKYIYSFLIAVFLISFTAHSQTLSGIVKDSDGNTLPSASVLVDGETGTFCDFNGNYRIEGLSLGKHTIEFGFIGYIKKSVEIEIAIGMNTLNVRLKEDAVMINDVIVVGYGVQRKKEVTGSIAKIDAMKITSIQTPSFEAALQGQAAGVQVSQSSGAAGAGSLIRIRGIASISGSGDPLVVVDGIPITQEYFLNRRAGYGGGFNNNPLASINPNDIESVEILKDAAATGIYGSRGANGVILITTKRGTSKTSFEYSSRVGFSQAASRPNMMNTEEYLTMRQEAWENDGGTGYVWLPHMSTSTDSPDSRREAYMRAMQTDTDWVDETTGTGMKNAHSFGARTGGDNWSMYSGFAYDENESYLLGNSYTRISGRMNLDLDLAPWAKLIFSGSMSQGRNQRVSMAWSGGLGRAMSQAMPYMPVRYENDTLVNGVSYQAGDFYQWNTNWNMVAEREMKKWRSTENRSFTNAQLILTPIENLHVKFNGGFDQMNVEEDIWEPEVYNNYLDQGNLYSNTILNWNLGATADYRVEIDDTQAISFLIGSEYQRSDNYSWDYYFPNATSPVYGSDSLQAILDTADKRVNLPTQHSFLSYFSRVNYALKDKYFFQATMRIDGSSRFGRNSRYGFFPAVSAGWVVSDENWFKTEKISFLKVRSSIGRTGSANIPDYARFGTYSPTNNGITYAGDSILYPLQPANPNLKWESTRTLDGSVEIGLYEDRIAVEIGAYHKWSTDVLMNVSVPASTGFTNYWDNVGTVMNRGIELSIKSYNTTGRFQWTTELNVSKNYNEIVDIGEYTPDAISGGSNDSRVIVGSPIGSFFLVEHSHIDAETGLPVYIDLEGNETFEYSNDIRKYVGDGLPDFIGGMTNSFNCGNWDLTALVSFSMGAKIFDSSAKRQLGVVSDWNMRTELFDRWQQPGDEATFPILTLDETTYSLPSGSPWWNTSLFIYDASYLRLRNLTLGYNVPGGNDIRLAINATNLFTLTNFPGLDPEVVRDFENAQDRNMSANVNYLTPPQERSFTFSITANF